MNEIVNSYILSILPRLNKLPENLIYLCYRGSIAGNTYLTPAETSRPSDVDLLGVYIAPKEYYIGISQHKTLNPTTIEIKQEINGILYDCVFYELRHFITMALRCNPNVICSLWVRPEHILMARHRFNVCLNTRGYFLSRRQLYMSFTGYAISELREVTNSAIKGYMGVKRKALVDEFGYDVKNAAQLVYLLTISIEALKTGHLQVFRTEDADLIRSIKEGKWELDDIKLYADNMFHHAKRAYESSNLPEEPKTNEVEQMVVLLLKAYITSGRILIE